LWFAFGVSLPYGHIEFSVVVAFALQLALCFRAIGLLLVPFPAPGRFTFSDLALQVPAFALGFGITLVLSA